MPHRKVAQAALGVFARLVKWDPRAEEFLANEIPIRDQLRAIATCEDHIADTRQLYIDVARGQHRDGELEIDDNPVVSASDPPDGGAYVQAWVWVPDYDLVVPETREGA